VERVSRPDGPDHVAKLLIAVGAVKPAGFSGELRARVLIPAIRSGFSPVRPESLVFGSRHSLLTAWETKTFAKRRASISRTNSRPAKEEIGPIGFARLWLALECWWSACSSSTGISLP
jgi:hypothetical protein